MFPIGDDDSDRHIQPIVNYAIIGINILVFLLLQQLGSNEHFTYAFSLVPKEITTGIDITGVQVVRDSLGHTGEIHHYPTPLPVYFNFLSSMFMHVRPIVLVRERNISFRSYKRIWPRTYDRVFPFGSLGDRY